MPDYYSIPYPVDYFDPYGDDPQRAPCDGCGEIYDIGDMHKRGRPGLYVLLCDECDECAEV